MPNTTQLYKLRHPKKRAFLDAFRLTGNITISARSAGVDRTLYYYWCEHDEKFAFAARQAEIEAIEVLEQEARRRAVSGVTRHKPIMYEGQQVLTEVVTEYSDTLLIFLLKGLKPERYRDTYKMEHSGPEGGPIRITEVIVERAGSRVE